jgi:hypothetical protein
MVWAHGGIQSGAVGIVSNGGLRRRCVWGVLRRALACTTSQPRRFGRVTSFRGFRNPVMAVIMAHFVVFRIPVMAGAGSQGLEGGQPRGPAAQEAAAAQG